MKLTKKTPEKYNAKDLLNYWHVVYQQKHNKSYQTHGFIGTELKNLKDLLESYNQYQIIVAMKIANGDSDMSVSGFCESVQEFITDNDARLQYYVQEQGTYIEKRKWTELIYQDSLWFPTPANLKRKEELMNELNSWIDSI